MTVSDSVIRPRIAVVLAAGRGTRMRSELPKVLHPVAGRPMISWVLDAARAAGCRRIVVIVGHGAERLRAAVAAPDVVFVTQEPQLGTGHALAQAAPAIEGAAQLLVLSGDVPLVSPRTLEKLVAPSAWGALAVAELDRPERLAPPATRSQRPCSPRGSCRRCRSWRRSPWRWAPRWRH